MWTCPHCGKASEPEFGWCPHCEFPHLDDDEESEEEQRESTAVQQSDFTPVQFKIWHVLAITALLALALAIYRLPADPPEESIRMFALVGSIGTIAALIAVMFALCRRG
jgi:hypothetical protein